MIFNFLKKRKKKYYFSIDPDQILLDSQNRPGFNTQQFEGVIEQSISKRTIRGVGLFLMMIGCIFILRLGFVQISQHEVFLSQSEKNRLDSIPIFSERGVIFDRNMVPLAWNIPGPDTDPFLYRSYISEPGFAHLLGYVGYPTRDQSGVLWRESIIGKGGIEKRYNDILSGTNGSKVVEVNAKGEITREDMMIEPVPGKNFITTIDARIQKALYTGIKDLAESSGFEGGAGALMNIKTGEIIALTSYPEFDSNILSQGVDSETISRYATDSRKVYLNRAVSGLYTPGSIMKPYIALGALQEGVVTPDTTIFSSGQVEIPNRYDPTKPQIFRDWKKGGHGPTNIYTAIAESVNTYFYAIGGGYRDQQALGISKIEQYVKKFGIATPTGFDLENDKPGTIPSPEWKLKTFKTDNAWRQGDTYNSAIGQFGFQVSVLQMIRAVAAIENNGTLIAPHITKDDVIQEEKKETISGIDQKNFSIIRDAMRQTVTRGTAQIINVPYVQVSAKTGTAQTGKGNRLMNSWTTGFFPSNNPEYAFVVVMESAPSTNQTGASRVMRYLLDSIQSEQPEFLGNSPKTPVDAPEVSEITGIEATDEGITENANVLP